MCLHVNIYEGFFLVILLSSCRYSYLTFFGYVIQSFRGNGHRGGNGITDWSYSVSTNTAYTKNAGRPWTSSILPWQFFNLWCVERWRLERWRNGILIHMTIRQNLCEFSSTKMLLRLIVMTRVCNWNFLYFSFAVEVRIFAIPCILIFFLYGIDW